jgi:hypothetical protein
MGMSGGSHTRVHNWVSDKNSDIKITASRFDEENDDFSSSLSVMIARDGQSTITADIPFSGFRPVSVGDATAQTHLAKYSDISTGKGNFVTVSEATADNSISAVGAIAITAYTTGQANWMFPGFNNTGAATFNINGVNTDAILAGGAALTSGMLLSGVAAMVISDAADFHLMNPQRSPANFVNEAGLQSDAVTVNKIADNTITLAKINHETVQGAMIYTDASGTPTYLAAGTSGYILKTAGASANPSWSNTLGAMTLSGQITGADQTLSAINLKDYGEITQAKGNLGATPAFDLSAGNSITGTVDQAITSSTITNPTASDEMSGFVLTLTNGGAFAVVWPTSFDWGTIGAPTLTASGTDVICGYTVDGGTKYHVMVTGQGAA